MFNAGERSPRRPPNTHNNCAGQSFEESSNNLWKTDGSSEDVMGSIFQKKKMTLKVRYLDLNRAIQANTAIQLQVKSLRTNWSLMPGRKSLSTSRAKESGNWFQKKGLAKPLGAHPSQSDGLMLIRATKWSLTIDRDS